MQGLTKRAALSGLLSAALAATASQARAAPKSAPASPPQTVPAAPFPDAAPYQWRLLETPRFRIASAHSESWLQQAVAQLESYHDLLITLTQIHPAPNTVKLDVILAPDSRALYWMLPGAGLEKTLGGIYLPSPHGIVAVAVEDETNADYRVTPLVKLQHEYAHHFMLQNSPLTYPSWYSEGFAEYVSDAVFDATTVDVGRGQKMRTNWLVGQGWLSLREVLERPEMTDARKVSRFYAQSWLLCHYLFQTIGGRDILSAYFKALQEGVASVPAMERAFAKPLAEIELLLRAHADKPYRFTRLARPPAPQTPYPLTALAPASEKLLSLRAGLALRPEGDSADMLNTIRLQAVRREAALAPELPLAQLTLAQAEIEFGEPAAAAPVLEKALAARPTDVEAHYLKGLMQLRLAEKSGDGAALRGEARRSFSQALRLNPDFAPALHHFAKAAAAPDGALGENALNAAIAAWRLTPQVQTYGLFAAEGLIAAGRGEEALIVLEPIALDLHRRDGAKRAVALIRRIDPARYPPALTP
jgi:tetratricopeptide (TPR) repeat protein